MTLPPAPDRWTVDLANTERMEAIAAFGFTERQARFLLNVNASRRPGEWQSYQVWFRAPRFDASGKKTQPARFVRVLFNGQLVQKEVDIDGPTRASLEIPEAAQGPLMIQGDHGPVAFRNIHVRPLRPLVLR